MSICSDMLYFSLFCFSLFLFALLLALPLNGVPFHLPLNDRLLSHLRTSNLINGTTHLTFLSPPTHYCRIFLARICPTVRSPCSVETVERNKLISAIN